MSIILSFKAKYQQTLEQMKWPSGTFFGRVTGIGPQIDPVGNSRGSTTVSLKPFRWILKSSLGRETDTADQIGLGSYVQSQSISKHCGVDPPGRPL